MDERIGVIGTFTFLQYGQQRPGLIITANNVSELLIEPSLNAKNEQKKKVADSLFKKNRQEN